MKNYINNWAYFYICFSNIMKHIYYSLVLRYASSKTLITQLLNRDFSFIENLVIKLLCIQYQKRLDLLLDLSSTLRSPTFKSSSTFILHLPVSFFNILSLTDFGFTYFNVFLWLFVALSLIGDCLSILSSSLRLLSVQVSVNLRRLPTIFIGFCSFSLDLWEEVVVLFLQPYEA